MVEGIAGGQLLILSFKHKICYTTLSVTGKAIIVWFNFPLNDCTGDQSQFFMMEKEIFLLFCLLFKNNNNKSLHFQYKALFACVPFFLSGDGADYFHFSLVK